MTSRRRFLETAARGLGLFLFSGPLWSGIRRAWAGIGLRLLPKKTEMGDLVQENPADLDTRNLEVTPLEKFSTMGPTDQKVDLASWRLEVGGLVARPLSLTYEQLLKMPVHEQAVLLICPGVFAQHGLWKGPAMAEILGRARPDPAATHLTISGLWGGPDKKVRFPLSEALAGRLFLAYGVNGQTLPQKHGFPLRTVAQGHYGYDWVKYVTRVTLEKA